MAEPSKTPPAATAAALSICGGAMVLKGISLFLTHSRGAGSSLGSSTRKLAGVRRRRMAKEVLKHSGKALEAVRRDSPFTRVEAEALCRMFHRLVVSNRTKDGAEGSAQGGGPSAAIGKPSTVLEGIDRVVFREILHNTFDIVAENTLMDRVFCVWDKHNVGIITLDAWFAGLAVFLRGTFDNLAQFCFAVYDLNADGFITKDEMFQLLKNCLIKHPQEDDPDESVRELVEIVLRKMDLDKDGKVSLDDFRETVSAEPLLLEAFGKCLPTERAKSTFLATLKP